MHLRGNEFEVKKHPKKFPPNNILRLTNNKVQSTIQDWKNFIACKLVGN